MTTGDARSAAPSEQGGTWWRDAVVYHIYVRSFCDSNGDGIGDLPGVMSRLDHLQWLGVDAIWLSPVMPSPNADWGYDVADYCDIHPDFGTLDDFDELITQATARGIKVLNDLVPNHTSIAHRWFQDARTSRDSPYRDYYVWRDEPNNWVSTFMGPAWAYDEQAGQYYLHNFLPEQPDLNWWEPRVAQEIDHALRFWFDRGVSGFRIDVCHMVVKDEELRDNPPATPDDPGLDRLRGQRQVYNANRPELHDVIRRWRGVAKEYDHERLLVGETFFGDIDLLPSFYGRSDDELHLAFNIRFIFEDFGPGLADVVDIVQTIFPAHAWPCWVGSNHDVSRFPTRWADGDERKVRLALMMLMTLRGTPFLYYGDEIGMSDRPFEQHELRDPVGVRFHPVAGRDPERTPMQWTDAPGVGFTEADVTPWLPSGDAAGCNVAEQRDDPRSVLNLTRELIALRKPIASAPYERLPADGALWLYRRGDTVVALNMGDEPVMLDLTGTVALSTSRDVDGQSAGGLSLGGWEGVVVSS